jgi:hypothetical protein
VTYLAIPIEVLQPISSWKEQQRGEDILFTGDNIQAVWGQLLYLFVSIGMFLGAAIDGD